MSMVVTDGVAIKDLGLKDGDILRIYDNYSDHKITVSETKTGIEYVSMPSPGRMFERKEEDPLSAWEDCYTKKIKKRILVKKAKSEIQRAWELWEEDKSNSESMFVFFCLLPVLVIKKIFCHTRLFYKKIPSVHSGIIIP